ncbi:Uma2 family endonuclease [Crocosphaera sp. XPORK-15E]|uniref:Uma2 family endonuclease n=1 Tax=Crocosphaera sp. XPORK-15E TaxID=3110247 RepID=UPI002B20E75D|nr:Uma2 family endonuclease [Crocosphaera sp. XPORK-15E]MEA5534469.1 Uma2 family endonuclease [Crocosphaera sp. XPORK-15E]
MIETAKLSVKDYQKIVETGIFGGRRIELIEGKLIEVSPETPNHANFNNKLYKYFLTLFNSLADVRSAHPVSLSNSEPQPDLVLAKLPDTLYDTKHPNPEDIYLLIEISYSTLSYDLNEKKEIYARSNIQEYWIIDLENHRLIIFRYPQGEDYQNKLELNTGLVSCLAFPNVKLDVNRLTY